ncbi:carbohydrate-binding protein [Cellulosilyticum sp. I15G10I2]|uniref:carbohydrate-binding protein n=1 Tax=Cellulosilyticum sp. I15G10I2 TaxID=1892843 RepID=UPI00085C3DFB|nr:carbohydrate-binding protein [Cellulosilyticum sp. I15G10I2]
MKTLCLEVLTSEGIVVCSNQCEEEVGVLCNREYEEGDHIKISSSKYPAYVAIQVDEALGEALVYMTGEIKYYIPVKEKRGSYSPKTFCGNLHLITARGATKEEIYAYRNLAKNVMDQHENLSSYPHALANVETRGEAVFAARNAIDGVKMNLSHGEWPYQSWGINRQDDAQFTLDFGRTVVVNKLVLYTRADFPHDNWWRQVTVSFSDGTSLVWYMEKSALPHVKVIADKEITQLSLSDLIKADDPSPFPALTQIEVYGVEKQD